jgi:hypothetical protein
MESGGQKLKRKILTTLVLGVAVLGIAWAAKKVAILHPEMTAQGSYQKPVGTLGTRPAQPWSTTTVAAGVDNKPEAGTVVTHVGEIVDFSCYLQVGKHGEKHISCGQKCVQNGQPIGLLLQDGSLIMLMPEEHDPRRDGGVDLRAEASANMGKIVEVSGTETTHDNYKALFVQGLTKK